MYGLSETSWTASLVALPYWPPSFEGPPPPPPHNRRLNIGYVSGDLNDHPLAHLMGSVRQVACSTAIKLTMRKVFGLHSKSLNIFVYSTSPSDGSYWRRKIEADSNFVDVSDPSWQTSSIVERIVQDQIHICEVTSTLVFSFTEISSNQPWWLYQGGKE